MHRLLVTLLILINFSITPQDMISIYDDYIPQDLLKNADIRSTIEINLRNNVEILPDLNYYYVMYLRSFFNDKTSNPDSNYLSLFRYYKNKYLLERSNWANNQILSIDKHTDVSLKKNAMQGFYTSLILSPIDNSKDITPLEIDKNLMEFFNYLFFIETKSNYDSSENYFLIDKRVLEEKSALLNEEYINFNGYTYEQKIDKIESDIVFWYLFRSPQPNKYKISTSYDAFELSIQTFDKLFLNRNNFSFGLSYNQFITKQKQTSSSYIYTDKPLPTFIDEITFTFPVLESYSPTLSADLSYKLALMPELEVLSYLKFFLGYSFIKGMYEDDNQGKEFYRFTYNIISGTENEVYVYKSNGVTNVNNHLGFIRVLTPLFYFSKSFYFEFGFDLSARFLNYNYEITKQSVRVKDNQETIESEEKTIYSSTQSIVNFSPVVSIVVSVGEDFNISLNNLIMSKAYLVAFRVEYVIAL